MPSSYQSKLDIVYTFFLLNFGHTCNSNEMKDLREKCIKFETAVRSQDEQEEIALAVCASVLVTVIPILTITGLGGT